jgi:ANTAR domain
MNEGGSEPDLRTVLRLVGGAEVAPDPAGNRTTLLTQAVRAAVDIAPGMLGCSLTEMDGARWRTSITSADLCRELDELQYREGSGPCVRAARDRQRQHAPDLDREQAAEFARGAQERGVRSVLSLPVQSPLRPTALNFYSSTANGFRERLYIERAELLSRAVSAVLVGRRPGADSVVGLPLETRELVIRARALLMEQHGWSSVQALDWLIRSSGAQRRSLFELAAELVEGGGHERGE